jgi:selT/selW/selH-like putative selenoprotein
VAAIQGKYSDVQTEMTKGSGGIFDVVVDGQRIFSKHEANRFPTQDEILAGIERLKKA